MSKSICVCSVGFYDRQKGSFGHTEWSSVAVSLISSCTTNGYFNIPLGGKPLELGSLNPFPPDAVGTMTQIFCP